MVEQIGRAPGQLAVLQSFVNTLDIEQSTDELCDPAALQSWLARAGVAADSGGQAGDGEGDGRVASSRQTTAADLTAAISLREALRKVLRLHVTHGPAGARASAPSDAAAELRDFAGRLPTRLAVGDDGRVQPVAAGAGTQAALARIVLIAAEAATLGTWERLKVCSADDCRWAFYDRSPTRNGCWCSMQICGSRAKSRAYRERAAARREPAGQPR